MSMTPKRKQRPSRFSMKTREVLLLRLEAGETLRQVCRSRTMPSEAMVRKWTREDPDGFGAQYTQARLLGYQTLADELLEIADDGRNDWLEREGVPVINGEAIARSRLRVDTRKWLLAKALPKIYGDRLEVDDVSERRAVILGEPLTVEQWVERFGAQTPVEGHGD
jgi:Bacteriophage Sf6, terminase small subunit-like